MNEVKVIMHYSKSTKRTHVYAEKETNSGIQTLYIQRDSLPVTHPEKIEVTVKGVE